MTSGTNAIALQRTVTDLVAEYEQKHREVAAEIEAFNAAVRRIDMASCVGGAYAENVWGRGRPEVYESSLRRNLLISGWKAIYSRLSIDRLASAKDKRLWERTIADPPPLTIDNAVATFGDSLLNARFHLLRGLAEVFCDLDPAYKSHSKVKIGVKALPKRIILTSVGSYGSYGRDKLIGVLNAMAAYRGHPLVEHAELRALDALHGIDGHRAGEVGFFGEPVTVVRSGGADETWTPPNRGVRVRKFQNGNAHVIFEPETLLDINRALAEFYGDVLPDAEDDAPEHKPSTAVARDLQFYPTPAKVIEEILYAVGIEERRGDRAPYRILEPSCGDGRILDAIQARGHKAIGVEVDPGRAAEARAKGHGVITGNFLEQPPEPVFDRVVMNPPFYGRHYVKHVRHALRFLKPGGILVSVLPASAHYDHGEIKGRWHDLPVASFAESGTNIPTGYMIVCPEAA